MKNFINTLKDPNYWVMWKYLLLILLAAFLLFGGIHLTSYIVTTLPWYFIVAWMVFVVWLGATLLYMCVEGNVE